MATINKAKKIVEASIDSKVPVSLWSAPGIGKSSVFYQVSKKLNIDFIDVRAALTEVGDWQGLPISSIKNGEEVVKFLMSSFLPLDPNWEGILFLDEISAVSKEVLNCLLQLVLDRRIQNHYILPEKCYIMAAGNPFGYNNPVSELGDAIRSRFCHINLQPTKEEWIEHAKEIGIRQDIIGFVKDFPNFLFPNKQDFQLETIESNPRGLAMLSKIINSLEKLGYLEDCRLEVATGLIGPNAAIQYEQRCQKGYQKIHVKKVIKDYPNEKENVLVFVEKGSIPEQKEALEKIFETGIFSKKIKDNEFKNVIEFITDLALDVGFIAVKEIDNKYPKVFERIISDKQDVNSSAHDVCKKLISNFQKVLDINEEQLKKQ